jgi:hypothetical protein
MEYTSEIKKQLGEENYMIYKELIRIQQMTNSSQTRLPFEFIIH